MRTQSHEVALPADTAVRPHAARDPKAIRGTSWQPSWSFIRLIIVLMPPLLAAVGAIIDLRATRQLVDGRMAATTSLLATYTEAAFAQASSASAVLADFVARNETHDSSDARNDIVRLAETLVSANLAVAAVRTVGPAGEIIADSRVEPAEWPADAASSLMQAHRNDETGDPLVSLPYLGPTNGERQFNVSVAVRDIDGEPRYVIAAAIVARELMDRVRMASPYRDFTITLFDRDGNVLARHPSIGSNLEPIRAEFLPPLDAPAVNGGGHIYVGHLQFSPRLRIIDTVRVPELPVYVTYSAAYWEALAPWQERSLIVGVISIAAATLLYIALGQLMVASCREIEAERSIASARPKSSPSGARIAKSSRAWPAASDTSSTI